MRAAKPVDLRDGPPVRRTNDRLRAKRRTSRRKRRGTTDAAMTRTTRLRSQQPSRPRDSTSGRAPSRLIVQIQCRHCLAHNFPVFPGVICRYVGGAPSPPATMPSSRPNGRRTTVPHPRLSRATRQAIPSGQKRQKPNNLSSAVDAPRSQLPSSYFQISLNDRARRHVSLRVTDVPHVYVRFARATRQLLPQFRGITPS
ncbi:hypothetical protein BCO19218_06289 [Burkholderia contaminans]|nr:hypothetical protein BCO19218_06289 [Burkholderia contaminans]